MRRWNGWGEESVFQKVNPIAFEYLQAHVGLAKTSHSLTFDELIALVPSSRLTQHELLACCDMTCDAKDRALHAVGQSLPDWIGLRMGLIERFPDAVAYPKSAQEIRTLLDLASEHDIRLIPYGGGTSVVGHLTVPDSLQPVVTVDMRRMNQLLHFDPMEQLATFEAGISGPEIEDCLQARGYTLGHYPQSFEYSTLGGWVATRSAGQYSLGYGRMDSLFVGGRLETPAGSFVLKPIPASAAGPDLRQTVLGSEGRLGIITECTVKVSRLPKQEHVHAAFFKDAETALTAVRELAQADLHLTMIRLSLAAETETTLALASHQKVLSFVKLGLSLWGVKDQKCLLLYGVAGSTDAVSQGLLSARRIIKQQGGIFVGQKFGEEWKKARFQSPYLRNTLWEAGYAIDTLETSVIWSKVKTTIAAIEDALKNAARLQQEQVHVFTHVSHVYAVGSSIYTTYVFRLADTADATLARWQTLKSAASQAIVEQGGTISHQHGVGLDHRPYLEVEKGELWLQMLRAVAKTVDPKGLMNPGKLME